LWFNTQFWDESCIEFHKIENKRLEIIFFENPESNLVFDTSKPRTCVDLDRFSNFFLFLRQKRHWARRRNYA
jgi:hypothetical protein